MCRKINNEVKVTGRFVEEFTFNHEMYGEGFYMSKVAVERKSGTTDVIPVLISDRTFGVNECVVGKRVSISGEFRSHNMHDGDKSSLKLFLFVEELKIHDELEEEIYDENEISLDGYICKDPVYRSTPLGRIISDVLLAVNRGYGKSDYIPCVFWGRNASYVKDLPVGANLKVTGRIQSRDYIKRLDEERSEVRTAYEISVTRVEVVREEREVSGADNVAA